MNFLKQSTAATIKLGPFIDDTDGKTAETGLTISQADIRLSKNGGDIAQTHNSAGATADELGYYDVPLDTTDTDTLGRLLVAVHESGALPVWQEFLVVTANVFDTLCSTDNFDVVVTSLADDVITAAKFDESTAFPLKSADTGSTAVARVGADSDTLETLSDQIDGIAAASIADAVWDEALAGHAVSGSAGKTLDDIDVSGTAAAVWASATRTLTQSAASVTATVSGSDITCTRGDSLSASLTDVGALTGYSKIYFTVKRDHDDADAVSIIQIEKTAGLKYIDGGAATTAANGSITIGDEATGDITVALDEAETAKLDPGVYFYDVQIVRTAGTVSTLTEGSFTVSADVTRATT